jgi:hypothetical protein
VILVLKEREKHIYGPINPLLYVLLVYSMACALLLARQELEEELEDLSQWLALLQVTFSQRGLND